MEKSSHKLPYAPPRLTRLLTVWLIFCFCVAVSNLSMAQCDAPVIKAINNINYWGYLQVATTLDAQGTYYIEIGPPGFTPGTGAVAGTGGTLSQLQLYITNGVVVTSAWAVGQNKDCYVRVLCGGGGWSPNSPVFNYTMTNFPCPPLVAYDTLEKVFLFDPLIQLGQPSNLMNPCLNINTGNELRYRLIVPDSGRYKVEIRTSTQLYDPNLVPDAAYRIMQNSCGGAGYVCLSPLYTFDGYEIQATGYIGPFQKGDFVDLVLDETSPSSIYSLVSVSCPVPVVTFNNIGPGNIDINWGCPYCHDSVMVEYGLKGFTPGTGLTAGPQGTLAIINGSPFTVSGLAVFTAYDVYIRSVCGGITSSNKKYSIKTAKDCSVAPVLNCGDLGEYEYQGWYNYVRGAWDMDNCFSQANRDSAEEGVFQITPAQTDTFKINFYNVASTGTWAYPVRIYMKDASTGCNDTAWSCMGNLSLSSLSTNGIVNLGVLNAGTTYYIRFDTEVNFTPGGQQHYYFRFQLQCTSTCTGIPLSAVTNITPTSVTVNAVCNGCFTNPVIEYGPAGFIPGTGAGAGGGTVISAPALPYTINGLTTGVNYDVYVRSDCSTAGIGIGQNYGPENFTPCSATPTGAANAAGATFPSICAGDSVSLFPVGGNLAAGCQYYWYLAGYNPPYNLPYYPCDSVLVHVGDSLTVAPDETIRYFLRAEGPCGVSGCAFAGVNVNPPPIVFPSDSIFCSGDTLTIRANFLPNGYFDTYLWSIGATTFSIDVTNGGVYTVTVTRQGCVRTDSVMIYENPLPVVNVTAQGPTTFCRGDSVTLTATSALAAYQWYRNNIPLAGATQSTYSVKSKGKYYCIGLDVQMCSDTSNSIQIRVPCIPIGPAGEKSGEEVASQHEWLNVFPNPAHRTLTVQLLNLQAEKAAIVICDVYGQAVLNWHLAELDETTEVDISALAPGMYFITIEGKRQPAARFVKY